MDKQIKEKVYYVRGMHCASCELLLEKGLLDLKGVKAVEASTAKGKVVIEYENQAPSVNELNSLFKAQGYTFSEEPVVSKEKNAKEGNFFNALIIAAIFILVFLGLNKLGIGGLLDVSSKSSLATFFIFGLLAGISSCAALVGGMVLSMSKQWAKYKFTPHLLFNGGRLISYAILGAVLGAIGSRIRFSQNLASILVLFVALIMIFLALQMLGVKAFRKFQLTLPKFITRRIANESRFESGYLPFILGAFTFFLPCGFTIAAQGLALLSGNALQGGLIMLSFALGTLPSLIIIGISSTQIMQRPHLASTFLKVAGILVLFFALFNINAQFNVLGIKSLNDIKRGSAQQTQDTNEGGFVPIVDGKQIIKMNASSTGYSPNYFKVKTGIPVRWEITDTGTSGCTNAVISKSLFDGQIDLTPGKVSVKEFTPTKAGKYKFSCWMGMITGTIEVVDKSGSSANTTNAALIPSGASGCGCGGGGQNTCHSSN